MRASGTSWLGNAGYRSYERLTRVELAESGTAAAALAAGGLALGDDTVRLAVAFVVVAAVVGSIVGWGEVRRLRGGLSTARVGALPPGERPLEDLSREWRSVPLSIGLRAAVFAAVAAGFAQLFSESLGHGLSLAGGLSAGQAVGQALVLVWLRRRRRRDGMELHVREVEGDATDDPPRLLLVPRGS